MRIKKWALAGCLLLGLSSYANAELYSNDLAKCMVTALDGSDKQIIQTMSLQMIFAHPNFAKKNPYSAYEITQTKRQFGALLTRLVAKNCLGELLLASHYDGKEAITGSMQLVGQYAFDEIHRHPSVQAYGDDFATYMDERQLRQAVEQLEQSIQRTAK